MRFEPIAKARLTGEIGADVYCRQSQRRVLGRRRRIPKCDIGKRQEQSSVNAAAGIDMLIRNAKPDHKAGRDPAIEERTERVEKRAGPEQRLEPGGDLGIAGLDYRRAPPWLRRVLARSCLS